jgi:hypothetical protein
MVNNVQVSSRRLRLNPFVFPSDTTVRFMLLIMCVVGASLWIYNSPLLQRTHDFVKYFDAKYQCIKGSGLEKAIHEITIHDQRGYTDFETAHNTYQQCITSFDRQEITRMLVGVLLLLSVAGIIYLVLPAWKRWRKRLVPLPIELMPDVAAELANLCHEAGLAQQPTFVWNPLSSVSEGLAFGRLGRYSVALSGGLVKQFYTDRPAFHAVIRHELAHLHNADIDKTYFSVAIWWAFVLTALAPSAVYLGINFAGAVFIANLTFYMNLLGRVLALAILVFLTRNAVLRARELYADVRASTWDGSTGALKRLLAHSTHLRRNSPWTILLAHPAPEMRLAVVNDTRPLFQSNFWTAFGTGIASAIAFNGVYNLSFALSDLLQFASLTVVVAGLLFGGLTIGVVGSLLWRATFATLVEGKTPQRTGWIALGVVLGIASGLLLSLSSSIGNEWPPLNVLGSLLVAWTLWGLTLLGSLWLVLRWLMVAATTWLPVTANTSILRWSSRSSLIVAGGIWATFFGSLLLVSNFFSVAPGDAVLIFAALLAALLLFVAPSFIVAALIGLWAIPLAASFWRRRGATIEGANWAFLDTPYTSQQRMTLSSEYPFRLRFAAMLGLVGGLTFCGFIFLLRMYLQLILPQASTDSNLFRVALGYGYFALAALLQAGIAAIVTVRLRHLKVLHALYAAFIGGCVMTVGILGLNLVRGGMIDVSIVLLIFSSVLNGGTFLAVPTALCVAVLTQWSRATSPQQRAFPFRFAIIAGLLSGLTFCAIAVVISVYLSEVAVTLYVSGSTASDSTYLLGLRSALLSDRTLLAVLFQAAAAAIVTVRVKQWRVLQGLLAALIGGCVMLVGVVVADLLLGDLVNLSLILLSLWYIVASGMLLALPTVLFASLLTDWRQQTVLQQRFLHARLALRIGLIGGLIFCLFVLVFTVCMPLIIPAKIGTTAGFGSLFYSSQISLAVLIQSGIAAVAACRVRRLSFPYGLLAAFIGGCAMAVGILISLLLYRGVGISLGWLINFLDLSASTFFLVLFLGAFFSLPVALVLSLLAKLVRRLRRSAIERAVTAPLI